MPPGQSFFISSDATPVLHVALDDLETLFYREHTIIGASDVPALMAAICVMALNANKSNNRVVSGLVAHYEEEIDTEGEPDEYLYSSKEECEMNQEHLTSVCRNGCCNLCGEQ